MYIHTISLVLANEPRNLIVACCQPRTTSGLDGTFFVDQGLRSRWEPGNHVPADSGSLLLLGFGCQEVSGSAVPSFFGDTVFTILSQTAIETQNASINGPLGHLGLRQGLLDQEWWTKQGPSRTDHAICTWISLS